MQQFLKTENPLQRGLRMKLLQRGIIKSLVGIVLSVIAGCSCNESLSINGRLYVLNKRDFEGTAIKGKVFIDPNNLFRLCQHREIKLKSRDDEVRISVRDINRDGVIGNFTFEGYDIETKEGYMRSHHDACTFEKEGGLGGQQRQLPADPDAYRQANRVFAYWCWKLGI